MSKHFRYSLYILAAFSTLFVSSCSSEDPKQALKQSLYELISSIEQKKQFEVSNKLTSNFVGNRRLNQQEMTRVVFGYYIRHKFIKIYTLVNSIDILSLEKANARAKMTFHVALTSTKNTLPEHMRVFSIDSHWVLLDKKWKMQNANWIEVRPQTVYPQIKKLMEK